jgi:hypothetical protein
VSLRHDEKEIIPVSVIALLARWQRSHFIAHEFSSAERKYSVPIECFHDLIVDLQRLNASQAREFVC